MGVERSITRRVRGYREVRTSLFYYITLLCPPLIPPFPCLNYTPEYNVDSVNLVSYNGTCNDVATIALQFFKLILCLAVMEMIS